MTVKTIQSEVTAIQVKQWSELANYLRGQDYTAVLYCDDGVKIGHYREGAFDGANGEIKDLRHVQTLRIFNENEELMLKRKGNTWSGRLRTDYLSGETIEVNDREQILVGTSATTGAPGFTTISEERGACLELPLENITIDDQKQRAYIATRNYIGYLETHQASYIDTRFVKLGVKGA